MTFHVSGRAVVCAFVASLVVSHANAGEASPRSARNLGGEKIGPDDDVRGYHASRAVTLGDGLLAYPPAASNKALTVVYLHGRNGRAANGCPYLRAGASELGWLVCPTAVEHEAAGTASWGADVAKQASAVDAALHTAVAAGSSGAPGVAVGFSQGGYVALDLVKTNHGHFRGLVLIAAPEAHPSAEKLHAAGITRVALGAGKLDAAYAPLAADAKRLASEGMEVRFVDLGNVGHTYVAENPDVLADAIAWAGGDQSSSP